MEYKNYENQTFDTLPEAVIGCNFENCTFNASTRFERCNIRHSTFTVPQEFDRSNVIVCEGTDGCTFTLSNNVTEEEPERYGVEMEE